MSYNKKILDYFNATKNIGEFEASENIGIGMVGSPSCGDVLKLSIKIHNNTIIDAKFLTYGCGAAIASSAYLTEQIIGKSISTAKGITNKKIADELGLPPIKYHCSVLAEEALEQAINDYKSKACDD